MAFLPTITYVNEISDDTVTVVPGCYSPPSLDHFVWLGEVGEAFAEYKVEKVSHHYTPDESINPETGRVSESVDGNITIIVSQVP